MTPGAQEHRRAFRDGMAIEPDLGARLAADGISRWVEPEPLLDHGASVGQRVQIGRARRAPAERRVPLPLTPRLRRDPREQVLRPTPTPGSWSRGRRGVWRWPRDRRAAGPLRRGPRARRLGLNASRSAPWQWRCATALWRDWPHRHRPGVRRSGDYHLAHSAQPRDHRHRRHRLLCLSAPGNPRAGSTRGRTPGVIGSARHERARRRLPRTKRDTITPTRP